MEFVNLGKSGLKVSRLCLGTMIFGSTVQEDDSISLIHKAIDDGINFVDTANGYNNGLTEEIMGKALVGKRNDIVLTSKVNASMGLGPNDGGLSRYHIMREIENSLSRLKTDHIDIYMLHRPDPFTPLEESIYALNDLVTQGKIRYIGMPNHPAWQVCSAVWISELRNLSRVSCVQDMYNIVNRDIEVELLPFCQEYGIGVMA
jgi:aryl-alcohol dehydrogenase-like predicted oxidoreductase